jgi:hypothetical protein
MDGSSFPYPFALLFSLTILEHVQTKPPGELVVMGDSSLMKLKR